LQLFSRTALTYWLL